MTLLKLDRFVHIAAASATLMAFSAQSASAGALSNGATLNVFVECINDGVASVYQEGGNNGWHYTSDSANDGTGGSVYDIFGMAVKETQDSVFVVINGNMPLSGADSSGAWDTKIGWGDLFINLSPEQGFNSGNLFGVRFADPFGDLPVGVYGGVDPISVTGSNNGWKNVDSYTNNFVRSDGTAKKSNVEIDKLFGDLSHDTDYFDRSKSYNAIGSGAYLGGIEWLDDAALKAAGFETQEGFGGSETVAFRFDSKLLTSYVPDLTDETYTRFIGKNWQEQLQHNAENAGIDWQPWEEQLNELQQTANEQLQPLQEEMDRLMQPATELQDLVNYVKDAENQVKQIDRNLSSWQRSLNSSQNKVNRWENERNNYQQQRDQRQQNLDRHNQRLRDLQSQLSNPNLTSNQQNQLKNQIKTVKRQRDNEQRQINNCNNKISQRDRWIGNEANKIDNYQQNIDGAKRQKDELQSSIPDRTRKELENDLKQLKNELSKTDDYKAIDSQMKAVKQEKSRGENQVRQNLASKIQTSVSEQRIASASNDVSVPEPSTVAGLAIFSLFGVTRKLRRRD
ncbi:MAG: PEP-CTERM sorting domain-containing protein [Cyanobacteria bacterium SID2]|nr:PEP-CTERM sorting domain-containing protein [Cyanobacteria bacterium SID2]MBP0002840.1 PEP-CTERM sorting domain-containing protein [Cyanobacteria bacterium SBC]